MNRDLILKRAKKLIADRETAMNQPRVMVVKSGCKIPEENGLVVVLFNENKAEIAA